MDRSKKKENVAFSRVLESASSQSVGHDPKRVDPLLGRDPNNQGLASPGVVTPTAAAVVGRHPRRSAIRRGVTTHPSGDREGRDPNGWPSVGGNDPRGS